MKEEVISGKDIQQTLGIDYVGRLQQDIIVDGGRHSPEQVSTTPFPERGYAVRVSAEKILRQGYDTHFEKCIQVF